MIKPENHNDMWNQFLLILDWNAQTCASQKNFYASYDEDYNLNDHYSSKTVH